MKTSDVVVELKNKLPDAIVRETDFCGETTLEVRKERLLDVLTFLKTGYEVLMDLTAVDYLVPEKHTKVVYWLYHPLSHERIRVVIVIAREEKIPSVRSLWEGADWYERELYDMFGVHFEGFLNMERILMPDDWKGHPMRRDYALTEEVVEFKHGVDPKIPSEIINIRRKQKYQ